MARVLAVAGLVASGKTTLVARLQDELEWDCLSIDSERAGGGDWKTLLARLDYARKPTIVESVLLARAYEQSLLAHDTCMIRTVCSHAARMARLNKRDGAVYDMAYEPTYRWRPLWTVDTTHPTSAETVVALVSWARGGRKD